MVFYTVERKVHGKWVQVSQHGLWNEGRKALDRLQNQHGASYVRMRQTTSLSQWEDGTDHGDNDQRAATDEQIDRSFDAYR